MTGLIGDLRYAVRALLRNRGFTLVAVASLALGIGANTTIFTLLNAIFFRSFPVRDPESLAVVVTTDRRIPGQSGVSYPNYSDFRDHSPVFSSLLLYTPVTTNLTGHGDPQLLMTHLVSGNYFEVTGVHLTVGRGFLPEEDAKPGDSPVAVIAYQLWLRLYGGDRQVTSRTIELNGVPYRIVGVAPDGFRGLHQLYGADVFIPIAMHPKIFPIPSMVDARSVSLFAMVGRLKPGVTVAQAESGMQILAQELEQRYPENRGRGVQVLPLHDAILTQRMRPLVSRAGAVLMALSAMVLLIACGNVANLLLARAAGREREMAVRLAVGAGRWQIARQLLVESVLLSLMGGGCGLLLARGARDLLWLLRPPMFNRAAFRLDLDLRVLLFTLAVAIATGVLFGLAPALRSTNPNLAEDLKDRGSGRDASQRTWSPRNLLVILQVAFCMVALVGAGLFVQSLRSAAQMDLGFAAQHLGIVAFNVNDQGYSESRGRAYQDRALERVAAVPGVAAVTIVQDLPFHISSSRNVKLDGQESRPTLTAFVHPGYFQAMGIPLLRGHDFDPHGGIGEGRAIINEAAAAAFWPNQDPVGRALPVSGTSPIEVIGVARNATYQEIGETPKPLIYLSILQHYRPTAVLYFRTAGDPAKLVGTVKREMQLLDRNLLLQAETFDVSIRDLLWVHRLSAVLLSAFGGLALVLSAIGIYGVLSYSVRQRSREIGVRVALGATLPNIRIQVLRQGMRLVIIGLAGGAAIAWSAADLTSGLLFLHNPRDWFTFSLVPVILAIVGAIACWVPAMRASRVDPAIALRAD